MEKVEKMKEDSAPKIKLVKAATPAPKAAGKYEVYSRGPSRKVTLSPCRRALAAAPRALGH